LANLGTASVGYKPVAGSGQSLDLVMLRAFRGATDPAIKLRALAALDPERAIEWMLASRSDSVAGIRTSDGAAVLLEIVRRASAAGDDSVLLRSATAVSQQPTLASADLLVELVRAMDRNIVAPALGSVARSLVAGGAAQPELVALAAEAAVAAGHAAEAEQLITQLSREARTPTRIRQVQQLQQMLPEAQRSVRIALLSSYTIDPLRAWLEVECRNAGLNAQVYVAPFNSWEREMRDPGSALFAFTPDIVFVAAAVDDLIPDLRSSIGQPALTAAGDAALDRVLSSITAFRQQNHAPVVVHSFFSATDEAGDASGSRAAWLAELNAKLAAGAAQLERCYPLDLGEVLASAPAAADDARLRHLARMRLTHAVLPELARASVRRIVPALGLTRKCVVLDLDNTLWGGIVGEVGTDGLRLGESSPGSEYVEFQLYLKALTRKGFLLAIASKNNEADALDALRNHKMMVLRPEDFVASRINWLPKPDNLRSIAEELNLGLDAFVFVDDNPAERAQMRRALPQVLTVELPSDAALYRKALEELPGLQRLDVTEEDGKRTQLYQARRAREDARAGAESLDQFLASLSLVARVGKADRQSTRRIQQLFERTNQFNLTTRRYDLPTIEERAAADDWRVYQVSAKDRFSDHGLVGAAVVRANGPEWSIENLVLSCRLIGYGAETALLATIERDAIACGAHSLCGEFLTSPRNQPAREFYRNHGFTPESEARENTRWRLDLTRSRVAVPQWLEVVHDAS